MDELQKPQISLIIHYSDKEPPQDLRAAALRAYAQAMIDRYRAQHDKSDILKLEAM